MRKTPQKQPSDAANFIPGDVAAAVAELGVRIARVDERAGEATGWCAAHEERTGKSDRKPSWSINLDSGLFLCFSCDWRGNFNYLTQYMLDVSEDEARSWIWKRGPIEKVKKQLGLTEQVIYRGIPTEITEADLALFKVVPVPLCYEKDLDPDAVDHYGILWDPAEERWIFPVRHPRSGQLLGWQEKGGTPDSKRYFRNQPEGLEKSSTLFGLKQFAGDTMILVESPRDCARILSAGIPGAVSTMGAHISDAQLDLVCRHARVVISALDDDSAGDQTNAMLQKRLAGRVVLKFWEYGDCGAKDPGDQTDDEIWDSYERAYSSILARF